MDNNQAKELISSLFTQAFDRQRYEHFLRNLLNHFEPRSGHYTGNWRIGKYVDPEGEELDLLVVEVSSFAKLERARSSLRNFAVNRLKQFEKDASLIAFYARDDGGEDWRFSFVKIEHEAFRDSKGKVKLKQELTPARRHGLRRSANRGDRSGFFRRKGFKRIFRAIQAVVSQLGRASQETAVFSARQ